MTPARRRKTETRAEFRRRTPKAAAKAEYEARLRRGKGLPREVARGHGPLPIRVARKLEEQIKGKPRALKVATQQRFREGIAEYERRYTGGLATGRAVPRRFPSRAAAERFVEEYYGVANDSYWVDIEEQEDGSWRVITLR